MVQVWGKAASAAILGLCFILLLICVIGKLRKRKGAWRVQSNMAGYATNQDLSAEAVQAGLSLNILTDIVYCESEEIIPIPYVEIKYF